MDGSRVLGSGSGSEDGVGVGVIAAGSGLVGEVRVGGIAGGLRRTHGRNGGFDSVDVEGIVKNIVKHTEEVL